MPKKTATARGGAQRNRPKVKVQKSFELVRQASEEQGQEQELEATKEVEPTAFSVSTMATPEVKPVKSRAVSETKRDESAAKSRATSAAKQDENTSTETSTAAKGSAAARLATRRQAMQKAQQRTAALITAEHYAYVRKDLVFIAILAAIMFSAIIILHFVPGIGS